MDKGIYTLVLELSKDRMILVGSLGALSFAKGFYAYTGSARGPGGFKRLMRHLRIIQGVNMTKKWHIDYLTPLARFHGSVITFTDQNLECQVASRIGAHLAQIRDFGCTDCLCSTHLHYSTDLNKTLDIVKHAHQESARNLKSILDTDTIRNIAKSIKLKGSM
jgi:Uri superfamily endonuclease